MAEDPSPSMDPLPAVAPVAPLVTIVDESGAPPTFDGTPMLVCFPSAGLASTIVGHHTVRHLKLPRIATVRSSLLPPASVIMDRRPNPPVRIHGNRTLVVALSEFPAPGPMGQPFGEALLAWAQRKNIGPIIVVEGVIRKEDGEPGASEKMMGIAATQASEAILEKAQVPVLVEGIVGGLTAEMLNLASLMDRSCAVLFASTPDPGYPDYRAAARLTEVLDRIVKGLALDPAPMLEQAELLEKMLKEGMKLHKAGSGPFSGVEEGMVPSGPSKEPSIYG